MFLTSLSISSSQRRDCEVVKETLQTYYLSVSYSLEFCVGFLGNLVVVLGYMLCLPQWQSFNIYLMNLAVSDLIFLCTLPRLAYLYANDQKESSPYACMVNRYILHMNLYSSILFMVWLSMDRFLLIKHPFRNHYLLRSRTALIVSGLTWLAVNVQVCPLIILMIQDQEYRNWSTCTDFASLKGQVNSLNYSLGLTLTGYVLPLIALCCFSYQIAHLLRVQETVVQQRGRSFKRPLRVVVSVAAMFFCLYTPYHVLRNVTIAYQLSWPRPPLCTSVYTQVLYILSRPLAFLHSVINPVFYFFMGDKFKELLSKNLRKLLRKTEQQKNPSLDLQLKVACSIPNGD